MPLTSSTVTKASLIMLPAYVIVAGYIGLCYLLAPESRLQGPALKVARHLLPMEVWGVLALALAVAVVLAIATQNRQVVVLALCVGAVAYEFWCIFYAISVIQDPTASPVTPIWPFGWGIAHIASAVSLSRDEVQ
jgi:hypothetical protein